MTEITAKRFYWYLNTETKNVRRVYLYEVGEKTSRVLVGNHKNMNPNHSIGHVAHPERFDDDPTNEEVEQYVANYTNESTNPETGRPWSVWFEDVQTENLKTDEEFAVYIKSLCKG